MSSYLNFYLVPKKKQKYYDDEVNLQEKELDDVRPMLLMNFSRSNEIYQAFNDNLNIAYAGNSNVYTELTSEDLKIVIDDIKQDIEKVKKRIEVYYKINASKTTTDAFELANEIISDEEYLETLQYNLHQIEFIDSIVEDCKWEWTAFEKIVCNID